MAGLFAKLKDVVVSPDKLRQALSRAWDSLIFWVVAAVAAAVVGGLLLYSNVGHKLASPPPSPPRTTSTTSPTLDVPEPRLAAARVLARDESEPGGELAAVLEVMAIANGGNQGRCSDGSDAKARLHTAGERIGAHVYFDLLFVLERLGLQSYGVLQ
jgi:hypothetical protein